MKLPDLDFWKSIDDEIKEKGELGSNFDEYLAEYAKFYRLSSKAMLIRILFYAFLQARSQGFKNSQEMVAMVNQSIANSNRARKSANARHDKQGGSRDMSNKMIAIWKTGKYKSRDICAEQECAGLNISFSKARKALRNTPDNT